MLAGLLLAATVWVGGAPGVTPPSTDPVVAASAAEVSPLDAPTATSATATSINEFVPDDVNLSECISALPRPGCGSKERGGWRQTLLLAVLVAGLAIIGWRLVVAVRRGDRSRNQDPS